MLDLRYNWLFNTRWFHSEIILNYIHELSGMLIYDKEAIGVYQDIVVILKSICILWRRLPQDRNRNQWLKSYIIP